MLITQQRIKVETNNMHSILNQMSGYHIVGDWLSNILENIGKSFRYLRVLLFNRIFVGFVVLIMTLNIPVLTWAQDNSDKPVEMADAMHANGKIYVVILIIGILFTALLFFAVQTDRKVSRLEKEVKNMKISDES
jgi:hypothetical protein